jgi:hypothetical protein
MNKNLKVDASIKDGSNEVKTTLSLFEFKEDKAFIIYSPALDLSGYGYTKKEAMDSFSETLQEFFRYTINKNSIVNELKRLGWQIKGGAKHPKFKAPDISTMMVGNSELKDIVEHKEFKKINKEVQLPAYA